jgi:hypothetical protein
LTLNRTFWYGFTILLFYDQSQQSPSGASGRGRVIRVNEKEQVEIRNQITAVHYEIMKSIYTSDYVPWTTNARAKQDAVKATLDTYAHNIV